MVNWFWLWYWMIRIPYRVRDGALIFEPTYTKRGPLPRHGVQALKQGSLKCLRGTHLGNQVQKFSSHTAFGGGFLFLYHSQTPIPPLFSPSTALEVF